jgi:hypothetical protein
MHGASTSGVEISHVSQHGFWLLLKDEELLVSFAEFPWFKEVSIEQLSKVELPSDNHLYWPQLDIDICVDSIRNPKAFPLISKVSSKTKNKT